MRLITRHFDMSEHLTEAPRYLFTVNTLGEHLTEGTRGVFTETRNPFTEASLRAVNTSPEHPRVFTFCPVKCTHPALPLGARAGCALQSLRVCAAKDSVKRNKQCIEFANRWRRNIHYHYHASNQNTHISPMGIRVF